ncbi:uncharacterized protein LOC126678598 [Mercurialis annua]|uniref:uncharacterized protein LOC126678598 n=1 Tax=Mercurialis annua TaxID=3986 RepID=UPI0024AEDCD9|nr:uncharacterized protein LOC126678598 [Mercurialis annua]XP_055961600.1 uncharacterized protein LOC126678598 [Mercurialis annua]
MKSLFDGITATGKDGWGPSRETMPETVNLDDVEPSFANEPTPVNLESPIDVDLDSPNSAGFLEKKNGKRHKKGKVDDIDEQLMAVLKTLGESDGPTIEECNMKLDEMMTLTMDDPLYVIACSIFCESKAYREQWLILSKKSEDVRINWIKIVAKKLGLL